MQRRELVVVGDDLEARRLRGVGDWIEKDLLKLSPWDVRRIGLDDYALVAVEAGGRIGVQLDRKNRLDLAYDDKNAKWSMLKLVSYTKDGEPKEEQLGADEELAAAKLNDLRNALGDLKIVDVARKPAGLSADTGSIPNCCAASDAASVFGSVEITSTFTLPRPSCWNCRSMLSRLRRVCV